MNVKLTFRLLLFIALLVTGKLEAQTSCTTLGQTPATAFPVCATQVFSQDTVPGCFTGTIPVPGCSGTNASYMDLNPFWYQFTCYQSGTLAFVITPNNLHDDYDWQLFDITGHNPAEVFTNQNLFVAGNWSGGHGLTGTSASATSNIECASDSIVNVAPTFSSMPTLKQGHQYLLLVSHWTSYNQSGYKLSFGGGTAVITDTTQPRLKSMSVSCDASTLMIKLNKKMTCASLASDGTDFAISPSLSSAIAASGVNCGSGFDMDSVIVTLNAPLPPGNYILSAKKGTDQNTLLDNCGTPVPVGDSVLFSIQPLQPTPMDSIVPVGCAPNQLQLIFKKNILCNSIAADGSDFIITGPSNITVAGAVGNNCSTEQTNIINIQLSTPIVIGGTYQVQLTTGSDGNTIVDACGQSTPAGSTLNFTTKDTVSASYTYQLLYGCNYDTVLFNQDGNHGISQWYWTFDSAGNSSSEDPEVIYSDFGNKNFQLIVSNGVCSDTSTGVITLNNELEADFEATAFLCPEDKASFKNTSIGNIVSWNWDLGDGTSDENPTPAQHSYPISRGTERIYTVSLIVQNNLGCTDTATQQITELRSCYIAVPNAFTPNGDGLNDYLYPLNAFKAVNLEFRVYNRYGQLVFETNDWTKKWDGTINGKPQDTGTYVWTLRYTDSDTGKSYSLKGTSTLIR